jgi:hypothetical protein
MKTSPWTSLGLLAVVTAGFCPAAKAGLFSNSFEMLVVAETSKDAPAAQIVPVPYCAIDGGYIEAGDAIAGENPPTADRVRQVLYDSMKEQGFEANRASPSILLTYFWGVLRLDREEIRLTYGVKSNLDARLRLVSTEELGAEVENHILGRQKADGTDMSASSPVLLVGPTETVAQNASRPRIFVIVSAFDYQGFALNHEAKLIWRTKLSALETSGDLDEVIPALIAKGAPFFGKNIQDPKIVQASLLSKYGPEGTPAESLQPAPASTIDNQLLNSVLGQERVQFSGSHSSGSRN